MSELILKKTLPKGWITTNLENVVEILDGKRVPINSKERQLRPGNTPYYGATGRVGWINDYLFDEELVLLGEDGAPFFENFKNKAYLISGKSWVNNHAHVLKGISKILVNKFLCYYLNQINYKEYVNGTTRLKLNQSSMKVIPIIIPPLNEQKRIVNKIESLFSDIHNLKQILERTKTLLTQYQQSLLKSAFEGSLVPQDPKDKQALTLSEKNLEQLPEGWIFCRMRDVVLNPKNDIVDGPFGSNLKSSEYVDNGVPILRLQNIDRNQFINKNIRYITKEKAEQLQRHSFSKNDIVITKLGVPVGKATLVPEYFKSGIIVADILRMRVLDKFVSRKFLTYMINSDIIIKQFANNTKGTTRPRVNLTKFRDFTIPLPPINEQKRIMEKIETCFNLINKNEAFIDSSLLQHNLIKISILQQAFKGKLVLQDPNDESVEKMLEKIKQEKEQLTHKQSTSRRKKNVN